MCSYYIDLKMYHRPKKVGERVMWLVKISQVPSQRAMEKLSLAHDAIARQLHQQETPSSWSIKRGKNHQRTNLAVKSWGIMKKPTNKKKQTCFCVVSFWCVVCLVLFLCSETMRFDRAAQELELIERRRSHESAEKRLKRMEEDHVTTRWSDFWCPMSLLFVVVVVVVVGRCYIAPDAI